MAGKVFDGVISFPEEMRFKKTFFIRNLWGGEKDLDKIPI